jgi:hypothetical protein
MTTRLSSLVVGFIVTVGALGAISCSQSSALPVSPSAAPVAGLDGSAAKATQNFCIFLRTHQTDSAYLVGQEISVSLSPSGVNPQIKDSTAPHGDVCFAVPATVDTAYVYINRGGYCIYNWVPFDVKGGPTYIWLLPADGNHSCSSNGEPLP